MGAVSLITVRVALLVLAVLTCGTAQTFPAGSVSHYRHERNEGLRGSVVKEFTLSLGRVERGSPGNRQWVNLTATKASGEQFGIWLLSAGYPPSTLESCAQNYGSVHRSGGLGAPARV